jgi:hypothetical protein
MAGPGNSRLRGGDLELARSGELMDEIRAAGLPIYSKPPFASCRRLRVGLTDCVLSQLLCAGKSVWIAHQAVHQ